MKEGWEYKKLGEVCEMQNGFAFKSSLFTEAGLPIVRISNIKNGVIDSSNLVYFDPENYNKDLSKYKVFPNDILIAMSGATTGKVGINKSDITFYLNQRVGLFREDKDKLNHIFLLYFLHTKGEDCLMCAEGMAQPNISTEQIKDFLIPLPPLSEQQTIVAELDNINEIIDLKKAQLKDLDLLAQSIFYEMFGYPIENSKGWEVKKLGEVCYPKKDIKRAKKYFQKEEAIRYLDISSVDNSSNTIVSYSHYIFQDAPSRAQQVVEKGDIVLSLVRPNLKNIAIVMDSFENMVASSGFCILRANEYINNRYLFYLVTSSVYTEYLLKNVCGANYPAVTEDIVKKWNLPLPPLSLQQFFAEKIEAIETQKSVIKQSLADVETLLASRMDYYFN